MDHLTRHILITGGGAPGAYGIVEQALQVGGKIFSCDIRKGVIAEQMTEQHFTVPGGDDPPYIDSMLALCKQHHIDLVIPITTKELLPLSRHSKAFKAIGTDLLVSEPNALEIANHKCALYEHLAAQNITVPDFRIAKNAEQFGTAVNTLLDKYGKLVFKPCVANGSRGFRIIDPTVNAMHLLLNEKPNSTYMNRDTALALFENNSFPPMLISEFLEGDEYSVDCLMNRGEILAVVPRKRLRINNGISVEGVFEKHQAIIEYVEKILLSLQLHGPIGVQVKMHKGQPYLLEINPRLQGTSTAGIGAGFDLVRHCMELAIGQPKDRKTIEQGILWGKHFVRHYKECFIN